MAENQKMRPNQKLRHERERRYWNQGDVADMIGTTPLNVGRWERGVTMPGPHFRKELSRIFEKSPQDLGLVSEGNETISYTPSEEPVAPLWNIPYRRNLFFTGREDILAHLHSALITHELPITITQPQAISGLGGVGKTQIAIEYAYLYREHYELVLWARAESSDTLISDFVTIAKLLHLLQCNDQDQNVIVNAVKSWFDTHEGWLLLLDNADHLSSIEEFIPSAGKGHVLLTARSSSTGTVAQRIELDTMTAQEGLWFLLRRSKRHKGASTLDAVPLLVKEQASPIVEVLDGLPLALDQAGAYIEETGCSFADYLKFYQKQRTKLLKKRGEDASGHPEPVATTWALSFARIERANSAAVELLKLCAFLHPDEIPETMLMGGSSALGPILQPVAEDELELNDALGELLRYSLIRRNADEKVLSIHRLVQAVLKDRMDREEQRKWVDTTVKLLDYVFPDPAIVDNLSTCLFFLPHARISTALIKQWNLKSHEALHLLENTGVYLRKISLYKEAEQVLQLLLLLRESVSGSQHPDTATALNELALAHYSQGHFDQTEVLYLRAIKIRAETLGANHPLTADILHNLAAQYNVQNKYDEAEKFYRQALAIREQPGVTSPNLARNLVDLSWLYVELGRYAAAEPLVQRALKIAEKTYGSVHPEVAYVMNSAAWFYYVQADYEQAEPFLERAVEINEQILGPHHSELAITINNLAKVLHKQGKYQLVEPLYQRALSIMQQNFGREHSDVAQCLHNLADLYNDQGRHKEAEDLWLEALPIGEKTMGPTHVNVARYCHQLGLLYTAQQRYEKAEPFFIRALTIREQSLGQEHPDVVAAAGSYADLLRAMGNDEQAIKFLEKYSSPPMA